MFKHYIKYNIIFLLDGYWLIHVGSKMWCSLYSFLITSRHKSHVVYLSLKSQSSEKLVKLSIKTFSVIIINTRKVMSQCHNFYNFGTAFATHQQWAIFPIMNVQFFFGKHRTFFAKCTVTAKIYVWIKYIIIHWSVKAVFWEKDKNIY